MKEFDVTITETLKRTVRVKANSADDAHQKVEDGWKNSVHVLTPDDFKEVHIMVSRQLRDRGAER